MRAALTQARSHRSARRRHHDPRGDRARDRAPLHPRSSNRLSVAGATPRGRPSVAEPKITRRSTLCGPNSRCDHAGRAAAALNGAPNQARSTTRRERRARARTAELFALALAPAPRPTTLKALDHSPDTKTCTSQLQTAAASTSSSSLPRGPRSWSGPRRRQSARSTPPIARAVGSTKGMKPPSSIPANAEGQASTCGSAGHGLRKGRHYSKGKWDEHRGVDGRGAAASGRVCTTSHR